MFQKLHTDLRGVEIEFFSRYGQPFLRYIPICKNAIFEHEIWALGKVSEVAHILSFYSKGYQLIFTLWVAVSGIWPDIQNCNIWAWSLATGKSSRSCIYTLFLPQGSNVILLSLYGQWFPRYGPNFKIAIFRYETWPLIKCSEVAHIPSFYPGVCLY